MKNSQPDPFFHLPESSVAARWRPRTWLTLAAAVIALAGPAIAGASNPGSQGKDVRLRVVSSPAQFVSGGDARIEVRAAPGLHDKLQFYVNGSHVDVPLEVKGSHRVEGVVKGLRVGDNTLEVYVKNQSLRDTVKITN